ncbi:MAG: helix-turn-helix transcriptional regulator [Clostridia bacterium]|nr:helix-turn-helix transcriptional regulator [Clostridia bacterium]
MNYKVKLNKKKIGTNIYFLIEHSQFTREDVADYLQLASSRVIYDWENGIKMPSTENLFNLAKLFNVQIEDILAI